MFYAPYAMGRMERLWGEDAVVFLPERWLDERGEFLPKIPFEFIARLRGVIRLISGDYVIGVVATPDNNNARSSLAHLSLWLRA